MDTRRERIRRRRPSKMEMSKKLLIFSDIVVGIVIMGTFIAVFKFGDLSPLIYLIPGVFALASVAHGFYFWKAKCENLKKFGQEEKITMNDSDYSG